MIESQDRDDAAEEILRRASSRVLGRKPRARFIAIVLWSSFLGATLGLIVWILAPHPLTEETLDFGHLTWVFLAAWSVSVVPALMAALLAEPRPKPPRRRPDADNGV